MNLLNKRENRSWKTEVGKLNKVWNNTILRKLLLLSVLMLFTFSLSAQKKQKKNKVKFKDIASLSGYVKYLNITTIGEGATLFNDNIIHNRLNFKIYLGNYFEVKLEARNRAFFGETMKLNPNFAATLDSDNGLIDMSWLLVNTKSFVINTKIDRAYINFYKGKFDIKIGRQRINWGITNLWNPNDLFNAYNFLDFDYEERPGTDAIRIEIATGDMSNLDFAVRPGKNINETTIALMYKFNALKYDFQVLGASFKKDLALGFGWAGAIKDIGFKGEATYFHPRKNFSKSRGTLATSLGLDYSFKDGYYANVGFLLNTDGISKYTPGLGTSLLTGEISPKSLMPTKYTFFGQVQKNFGPAWSANVSMIYGTGIHLMAVIPSVSYSIKENWDIDLTAQSFFVQQRIYKNIGTQVTLRMRYSY